MRKLMFFVVIACIAVATAQAGQAGQHRPPPGPPRPQPVKPPVINPSGGSFDINANVRVTIRAEPGTHLMYTLNGSHPAPGRSNTVNGSSITIDLPPHDVTVTAIATRPGHPSSPASKAVFKRAGRPGPGRKPGPPPAPPSPPPPAPPRPRR